MKSRHEIEAATKRYMPSIVLVEERRNGQAIRYATSLRNVTPWSCGLNFDEWKKFDYDTIGEALVCRIHAGDPAFDWFFTDLDKYLPDGFAPATIEWRHMHKSILPLVAAIRYEASDHTLYSLLPLLEDDNGNFTDVQIIDLSTRVRDTTLRGSVEAFVKAHPWLLELNIERIYSENGTTFLCVRDCYCG